MKYEYATRFYDASKASLSEILAKFGSDGWQMVTLLKLDGYDRQLVMMREIEEDKQPEKSNDLADNLAKNVHLHTGESPKQGGWWFEAPKAATVHYSSAATVHYSSPPSDGIGRITLICMNCKAELGDKDEIMLSFARRIAAQAELLEKLAAAKAQEGKDLFGYEFTQAVIQPHDVLGKVLSKYALEGWEKVTTVSIPDSYGAQHLIFRRKIKP